MKEFKQCVLESYRPLLEEHEFQELPKRKGESVNPYSVRIGNRTTVIEVEETIGKSPVNGLFTDPESFQKAIVMKEVIDPPVSLRHRKRG
jgi:hypothetical protein